MGRRWSIFVTAEGQTSLTGVLVDLAEREPLSAEMPSEREIYARHAPAVQRFLRDLLRDPADAADATQETFVRAFRQLHTLERLDRLGPWLFAIARNVCLEQFRVRLRDRNTAKSASPCASIDGQTPEAMLLGREAARVVEESLERLSADRRAALLLRVDHGLPYAEIAAMLGWSLAKAKVEVHRARCELRRRLVKAQGDRR